MIGGFLKSVGSSLGLVAPEAPKFEIPAALPAIQTPNAAALAEKAGLRLPAGAPVGGGQDSAALFDHLLNEKEDMLGATQSIAHGLPPRDGVKWAVDACKKVQDKLPPEHRQAIMAADEFALVPNATNRALAAAAAEKVGLQSPAGLAAKAASMVDVPGAPAVPGADKLVPGCVAGAVACAAALSAAKSPKKAEVAKPELDLPKLAKPEFSKIEAAQVEPAPPPPGPGSPESARNANAFKPFIEAGLAIAAGLAAAKGKK